MHKLSPPNMTVTNSKKLKSSTVKLDKHLKKKKKKNPNSYCLKIYRLRVSCAYWGIGRLSLQKRY